MNTETKTHRFSLEEKEVHLWYDPIAHLWTMDSNIPKYFNKAVKQGWTPISKAVYDDGTVCAMILTAPENAITIRNPNIKRTMSEKQKEVLFSSKNNGADNDFNDE